jgi:integrase
MLTGARPGEAASITLAQIDRSGSIWLYRPSQHKTQHHGKSRVIAIGPRAQSLLFEFIRIECPICGDRNRPPRLDSRDGVTCGLCADRIVGVWNRNEVHGLDEPIFSPKVALAEVYADRRATRKSRVPPSQKCRKKASPRKTRKDAYDITSYDRAIAAACKRAGVEHWHPNQLRHTHATEIRRKYGLEAAQVALGHSQANVTQVYAERDLTLATRIAAEIG